MPVSGAKNSALKLMAATLLAPGKTTLQNVPDISDVHVMGKVLKGMGATIDVLDEHTLEIDTSQVDSWEAPYELVAKMRASTAVMGPLLGRFHRAKIAMPGGCNLGARKIDMHILGLEALGVEFDTAHGYINANAPQGLRGTTVTLEFASVGATENLIMAAVRAQGTTVIGFPTDMQAQIMVLSALADGSSVITENIFENRFMFASELVRMGADIRIESHHAMIHGVKGFSGAQVTSPDLRGGAALVVAGLIADGTTEVSAIHHIKRGYEQFVEKLQALGAHVEHATVPDPVIY